MKKLRIIDFIFNAKKIHGERYNYSNVIYVNSHTKVNIICKKHGIFSQIPNLHVSHKQGCPLCANAIRSKLQTKSLAEFTNDSKKIHGE